VTRVRCFLSLGLVAALGAVAAGCASSDDRTRSGGEARAAKAEGAKPEVGARDLDARGLDPRWNFYLGEPVKSVHVVDDTVYVFTAKQNLYSMGLDDGRVQWVFDVKGDLSQVPAAYSYRRDGIERKDELYLVSKDTLLCLDKDAGFLLWKKKLPFAAASAPAASISHVYVGSWDDRIYAIDKEGQSIDWSYRTGAPVTAQPESTEKTVESVFLGSEDGTVYSMNPVREERKWAFETRGAVVARPVFFRNFVYAGSKDFNLYCIRALDGNLEWRYATGAPITKPPVAYTRDTIYVVSGEANLIAVNLQPDAKREYVRWKFPGATQVLAKGRRDVYVLDQNRDIVSLADDGGKPRWTAPLRTDADFFAMNPFDPSSLVDRERRLASTIVLGYKDGWMIAVKEKSEF
jgi:outer membrane protein assembly factor BamB